MKKKSIIIFRFHKEPSVCMNRLELLKFYNPDVPIYGIYGGDKDDFSQYYTLLKVYFQDIYVIKSNSNKWKWQNFDLVLLNWYCDIGNQIDFNMAYVIEWDLLVFGSIEDVYAHINDGDVGVTGLIPLSEVEDKWFWVSAQQNKDEWNTLLLFVAKSYQYSSSPFASLGPGLCFPKSFLRKYDELYLPELCNDEIRTPLAAQLLDFPIKNTGFFKEWFSEEERKYFNLRKEPIRVEVICRELELDNRNVFHPFHDIFDLSNIKNFNSL